MRLLVINPNSTGRMTALIDTAARATGATDIQTAGPEAGPVAIETTADEGAAVEATLAMLAQRKDLTEGIDAILLACYGDPGLAEIARASAVPAFGIAQLSMGIAATISERFGLIVAKPSAIQIMSDLARNYGHDLPATAIEASGVSVLSLLDDPDGSYPTVRDAAMRLKSRGVDVVCLACASMGQLSERLRADTGMVVIDAVQTSVAALRNGASPTLGD